ncbi:MAG: S8 family peptidase [Bacteroidaceae bacterium]|nr:S8 family peptidase [Bacteroidaceae bacterium]
MKKHIILLLVVGLGLTPLFSQSKLSPSAHHLLLQQKVVHKSEKGIKALSENADQTLLAAYIRVKKETDRQVLQQLGLRINLDLGHILTVQMPLSALPLLEKIEGVEYVQTASAVQPMMDKARTVSDADRLVSGEGLSHPFRGEGVIVGIIDMGFDYTHPNFFNHEKGELRIKRVWEQNYDKGTPPQGFSYGSELATAEAILEAEGDVKTNSHGTHVCGIATGSFNSTDVPWHGIAGDAEIVLVSIGEATANNVNISDAIAYIYNYADSVGKPCVINMSLGQQIGPHDGTSIFDQIADELQGEGRLLIGSVGNFGASPIHISRTMASADDDDLRTLIAFKSTPSASNCGGEIDIWGAEGMAYGVQIVVYNQSTNKIVEESEVLEAAASQSGTLEYEFKKLAGSSVRLTSEINPLNGKPHTLVSLSVRSLRYGHHVGLVIKPRSEGEIHAWADDTHVQFTNLDKAEWQAGDTRYTLAEIGGTGKKIFSIGAYTSRDKYCPAGSSAEQTTGETLGEIASFSSKGYTLDGRMKPEAVCPGSYIASSISSHDLGASTYNMAGSTEWNGKTYNYAYMQGTSMAAPFMTGVAAAWLQANPRLAPADLRHVVSQTARQDAATAADAVSDPGLRAWGYGKLNAYEGLKLCLNLATGIDAPPGGNTLRSRLVRNHSSYRVLFTGETADATLSLLNLAGRKVWQTHLRQVKAGQEENISTGHLPRGVYLLHVKTEHAAEVHKIYIK